MTLAEAWTEVELAHLALVEPSFATLLARIPYDQQHEFIQQKLDAIGRFIVDGVIISPGLVITVHWQHLALGVEETTVIHG